MDAETGIFGLDPDSVELPEEVVVSVRSYAFCTILGENYGKEINIPKALTPYLKDGFRVKHCLAPCSQESRSGAATFVLQR